MSTRFGLIGCGEIGRLRAAALTEASLPLTAVSDIDRRRAEKEAVSTGAAVETDWRSLIARADVDAVIVSTPPSLHAEMCVAALNAGKHVLCEKPLARNTEEARGMMEAAAGSGRFLATGFNYRFYPSIAKAKELLDSGIIGELDHIRSYTGYSATDHNHPWLHDAATMGGGSLRDNGIHLIDVTCYFLGEVSEMHGYASDAVWRFPGCEDNGFVHLRSKEGKIATVHASWTEWRGYRFEVQLYGSRGMIGASCFPMITRLFWAAERGGQTRRKTWLFPRTHLMEHVRSYRWVVVRSFLREHQEFLLALKGQPSMIATGLDGLRTIEIAEAAERSLRNRPQGEIHSAHG